MSSPATGPGQSPLGEQPAEFSTTGELAALLSQLPADTPVRVLEALRQDPAVLAAGVEERLTYAAQRHDPDDRDPVVVTLGAYYATPDRPTPADTIAVNPYDRAIEAVHDADDDMLFDALREMLTFIAGSLDGDEDAGLFEALTGDPRLAERARLEAQLVREAAARLSTLRTRIAHHLAAPNADPPAEAG